MSSTDKDAEPPRLSDEEMLARFSNSRKRPPCTETVGMRLTAVDQAKIEAANAGSVFPVAVLKRNGVGDVGRSFVVLELDDWLALLPRPF